MIRKGKQLNLTSNPMPTEHSLVPTTCAPKRAFRIGVTGVILTTVAKVMAKIPKRVQN